MPDRIARPCGRARGARQLARGLGALAAPLLAAQALVALPAGASPAPAPAATALVRVGDAATLPGGATATGPLPAGKRVSLGVALRPADPKGLENYATAVSTPGSAEYHRYLTPAGFARRFGASGASLGALRDLLHRSGLSVGATTANGLLLPVRGTVGQVEAAFHTSLTGDRLASGAAAWSATTPLLPAAVAGSVAAVVGLDDLARPQAAVSLPGPQEPRAGSGARAAPASADLAEATPPGSPRACSAAVAAATQGGGWTDQQLAQAYGLTGLYRSGDLGRGQTIDLYELEPFSVADLVSFDRCYFGRSHAGQVSVVRVDGFDLRGTGSGEALLDVEDLSALAPDARIVVYEAPNTTFGGLDGYNAIVSQDRANIVSTSWGECESALQIAAPQVQQVENTLFEEAAAQGQTVFAAAGDTGSDDCASTPYSTTTPAPPYLSVDDPASQPFVVGVGGTSLTADSDPAPQSVWNDGAKWGGGGGGVSNTWPSPAWQADSAVPGVDASENRQVPDVSAAADEWRGVTVFSALFGPSAGASVSVPRRPVRPSVSSPVPPPGWTTLGGTSSAAPIWAAVTVEIAASAACSSLPATTGGTDLGFLAPELYSVAGQPSTYAASFVDVTSGNNDVFGLGKGYGAHAGYNLAAGLGAPIVTAADGSGGLDASLCAVAKSQAVARPSVSGLSPSAGPVAGGQSVTISGSGFPAGDTAGVEVSFGATRATVTAVPSATSLVAQVPPAAVPAGSSSAGAGPVSVTVTLPGDPGGPTSEPSAASVYQYVQEGSNGAVTPSVSSVAPSGGKVAGGSTVTIYGEGFAAPGAGTPTVTFGGVAAAAVKVESDFELTATVPAEVSTTACATGPGFVPATACQVQVVVSDAEGSSPTGTILPAISGPITFDSKGVVVPTPETEVAPAATEYDYAAAPVITSVTPDPGDSSGTSPVVITGSGFDFDTLQWINFGPPSSVASEETEIRSISPTQIVIDPPAAGGSSARAQPLRGGVSVQSVAGLSNVVSFSYGGIPVVRGLSTLGGPASGGTVLHVRGVGLGSVKVVEFESEKQGGYGASASVVLSSRSDSSLTVVTPADLPGPVDVLPCSASGCARAAPAVDTFVYYSKAAPSLATIEPRSGPASGGGQVLLFGDNLDGAVAVRFGTNASSAIESAPGYPDGDPYLAEVRAAPGVAGSTVPVSVVTRAGRTRVLSGATYRYTPSAPSPPRGLSVTIAGTSARLSWVAPASDGGSPVSGYRLLAEAPGVGTRSLSLPPSARSASLSGLASNRGYLFEVAARNAAHGLGPALGTVRAVSYQSDGYRLATAAGVVQGFGGLPGLGGIGGTPLASPVVGMAATPDGGGYWLAQADGRVSAFGDALAENQQALPHPVSGIAALPDGGGYWLVDTAGDVVAFGAAAQYGSLAGHKLPAGTTVVGIAATDQGHGYLLATSSGAVYGFGDATAGPPSRLAPGERVVAIAASPAAAGYWLATSTGQVLAYGAARSYGQPAGGALGGTVVSMAASLDGRGYWLATSSGAVYSFGDAHYEGGAAPGGPGVVAIAAV